MILLFALLLPLYAGDDFDDVMESAKAAMNAKNYAEAEKKYAQAETLAGNNRQKADALLGLLDAAGPRKKTAWKKENWTDLERTADKIRSLEGLSTVQKIIAIEYSFLAKIQLRKYKEAEQLAEETSANRSFPLQVRVYTLTDLLAEAHYQQLKNGEMLSDYRRALSLCGPLDKDLKGNVYGKFIRDIYKFLRGKEEIHEELLRLCDDAGKCKELINYHSPTYIMKKDGTMEIIPPAAPRPATEDFRKRIRGDEKARILLDLADRKSRQEDFKKAESLLDRIGKMEELSKDMREKNLEQAWEMFLFRYARHFEFSKQYENALDLYYRLLKRNISNSSKVSCYLRIASNLTKLNKTEKALEYLEMANSVPDVPPYERAAAMIGTGDFYFETGDLSTALVIYQNARKVPDVPTIQIRDSYLRVLGSKYRFSYLKAGKCDELLRLLDEAETSERLSGKEKESFKGVRSSIHEQMIHIKREQKRYGEAQQFFRKALELPNTSESYRNDLLRFAHYIFLPPIEDEIKNGNYEKAERLLKEFKELPDAMKWHKYQITELEKRFSRGRTKDLRAPISEKIKNGQFDEAEKLLEEALAKPDLGDDARKELTKLLKKIPDDKVSAIRKECSQLRKKRLYDEEKRKLESALDIGNVSPDARHGIYLSLAENSIARKQFPEAEQYLLDAGGIEGISEYSLMMRYHKGIDCLLAQNRTDDALEMIRASKAMISKPFYKAENAKRLSGFYLRMKKYDEAISVLEETLRESGTDPNHIADAYSGIAEIYLSRKKDFTKAEEYLEKSNAVPNAGWGKIRNKWLSEQIRKAKNRPTQKNKRK